MWDHRDHITVFKDDQCWELEIRKMGDCKRITIHDGWIELRNNLDLQIGNKCMFKWKDESIHKYTIEVERSV